ncbi:hypothetical protein M3J09_012423 [Ascochyta lentis]
MVLGEMQSIFTGARISWEDLSDSDSDASTDDGREHADTTAELSQLLSNLSEINTCLMRLSISIRNPAPHDQFKESKHINFSHYETFDIDHVQAKYPHASPFLFFRLGKAISRRRQFLRYREDHRKKYEHGLTSHTSQRPAFVQSEEECNSHRQPSTVATASEEHPSTVASSLPWAVKNINSIEELDEHDDLVERLSQTSYALSTGDSTKLRPPPLPSTACTGQPFECTVCFRIVLVQDTLAWRKHVYRDLQPYVCTFEDCKTPDHTYESRYEWFQHESQVHRGYWECLDGCNKILESADGLRKHLRIDHVDLMSDARLDDLVSICYRPTINQEEVECVLCLTRHPSLPQLRRHLGEHQEELSLFALPSHAEENYDMSERESVADEVSLSDGDTDRKGSNTTNIRCAECSQGFEGDIDNQIEALSEHREVILHSDATPREFSSWRCRIMRDVSSSVETRQDKLDTKITGLLLEEIRNKILQTSTSLSNGRAQLLSALEKRFGLQDVRSSSDNLEHQSRSTIQQSEDRFDHDSYFKMIPKDERDTVDFDKSEARVSAGSAIIFDNKTPTSREIGRLVEANSGSESLDELGL